MFCNFNVYFLVNNYCNARKSIQNHDLVLRGTLVNFKYFSEKIRHFKPCLGEGGTRNIIVTIVMVRGGGTSIAMVALL